jgi:Polyketide cyclase / dehydrase and lipid transport
MTLHLSQSRAVPVPVDEAFDRVLAHPLPEIFRWRRLAIPPIREVRDQGGPWGVVGQTRTIVLSDGGTMRETLTSVQRPHHFGYVIGELRGPMKPLVERVEGRWTFEPAGTGTRITWSWDVTPTGPGRPAMPVFARMWRGYARQALEELESILLR